MPPVAIMVHRKQWLPVLPAGFPQRIAMRLSDAGTARLTLASNESERFDWDDALPGFGHRLRRSGPDDRISRRWVVQYRTEGRRTRRVTLGDSVVVRCAEARRKARELLARAKLGEDPQAARIATRRAVTFGTRAQQYLTEVAITLRPNTRDGYQRHLLTHARPLHTRPVEMITRSEIAALLSTLARTRGLITSNRTRTTLSAFFGWCVMQHELAVNPVVGTRVQPEVSRDRVLNDVELAAIWRATNTGSDFHRIIRMLLLTSCRRNEIGGMKWSEISGDVFTLPASRSKNYTAHEVTLHPLAMLQLPRRVSGRDAVFGRDKGFSSWSRCKSQLDRQLVLANAWRLHDFRRSAATWMAGNGIEPAHIDAVLNHVDNEAKRGIRRVYNRNNYEQPKRGAFLQWGNHIALLVGADVANVITLGKSG